MRRVARSVRGAVASGLQGLTGGSPAESRQFATGPLYYDGTGPGADGDTDSPRVLVTETPLVLYIQPTLATPAYELPLGAGARIWLSGHAMPLPLLVVERCPRREED